MMRCNATHSYLAFYPRNQYTNRLKYELGVAHDKIEKRRFFPSSLCRVSATFDQLARRIPSPVKSDDLTYLHVTSPRTTSHFRLSHICTRIFLEKACLILFIHANDQIIPRNLWIRTGSWANCRFITLNLESLHCHTSRTCSYP